MWLSHVWWIQVRMSTCPWQLTKFSSESVQFVWSFQHFMTDSRTKEISVELHLRKSERSQHTLELQFLGPHFFLGGRSQLFYSRLLARFTIRSLAKFGWVPFANLCLRRQWSRMHNLRKVGKNAGRVWSRLWTKVHDILGWCRRPLVVVNALDRSEDIGRYFCR